MSLINGANHPSNSHKLRFRGATSPGTPSGLGANGPMGILGEMAKTFSKVKPSNGVESFFLNTSKTGAMSIVPLESSVLVGRSERAYKRDGWLELQERLTEEMAAAVVWLFGVGFLQNQFEKVANRGKNQHLSTNIAWNKPWKSATTIDLTAQQMFAKHQGEINSLLGLKGARWVFSVGTALALVGYFIPKGNQVKTNMILSYLERRKRSSEGSNVQFGDPNNQNQPNGSHSVSGQATPPSRTNLPSRSLMPRLPLTVSGLMPGATGFHTGTPTSGNVNTKGSNPNQATRLPIATQFLGQGNLHDSPPAAHGKPGVKFAGGIPGLGLLQSGIQGIGAAVEQTDYGQILAVDFGIAGGRGYVASKRSPYETMEVLFRDIVSLYFYIMCAPHLMAVISSSMDKIFKGDSKLQPKVAKMIHDKIDKAMAANQKKADNDKVPAEDLLDRIIYGQENRMMQHEGTIKKAMRALYEDQVLNLLRKEAKVYLGKPLSELSKDMENTLKRFLEPEPKDFGPKHIEYLLQAIEDGSGEFAKLSNQERQNLGIAVKQATRHSAGIRVSLKESEATEEAPWIKEHPAFKAMFEGKEKFLSPQEENDMIRRIQHITRLDGMDQTHSMLLRSTNVMRSELNQNGHSALIKRADALADWIDKARHHAQTIDAFMDRELSDLGEQLHALNGKLTGSERQQLANALGRQSLGNEMAHKEALQKATTSQLRKLEERFQKIDDTGSMIGKLSPVKTQPRKVKAMKDSLASLKLRLGNSGSESPKQAIKDSIVSVMTELKGHSKGAEQDLLNHYHSAIEKIVHHEEGRLFSLAISSDDAATGQKLRETLRGGLISNSKLLSEALDTVGQLETDSRKMANTDNIEKMREGIKRYLETLYRQFDPANMPGIDEPGKLLRVYNTEMKAFYALNRNLHYVARGISLAAAMACIGWLVPKAQTEITKRLTGKDKNPGIASARKQFDDAKAPANNAKKPPSFSAMAGKTQGSPFGVGYRQQPQPHFVPPIPQSVNA